MNNIILVAESGADIPTELANNYGIHVLPMHVIIDGESLDDGHFPVERIFEYHKQTKKLPTTSATNPDEYCSLFEKLHKEHPDKKILHLCYSAVTTATYQNALIASEGMDYVTHIDTKNVTGGQGAIVIKAAKHLKEHPDVTMDELVAKVKSWIERARFAFFPGDLEYLRAGGRVSNAAYIGATILGLKPCIEIIDGKLVGTKKYRGSMANVCKKLIGDFMAKEQPEKDSMFFIYSEGLAQSIRDEATSIVQQYGCQSPLWVRTGAVISTHSGPGAFGIGGFTTV